jgi:hypothetical protein
MWLFCYSTQNSTHCHRPECFKFLWYNYFALVWFSPRNYRLDDMGFESRKGLGIFLFKTASRPALGPTQPPIQWVQGALSVGIKRAGREADHSHPFNVRDQECMEPYLHSPTTPSWRGAPTSDVTFIPLVVRFHPPTLQFAVWGTRNSLFDPGF